MTPDPATLTVRYEPLPPERMAAYWHAVELLFEIARRMGESELAAYPNIPQIEQTEEIGQ